MFFGDLKKEIIQWVGLNYPFLNQILSNFGDIIKTLVVNKVKTNTVVV